jgi:hypothetical protein
MGRDREGVGNKTCFMWPHVTWTWCVPVFWSTSMTSEKNSHKHNWGFIPCSNVGRRRRVSRRYVFVPVLLFTQTSGLNRASVTCSWKRNPSTARRFDRSSTWTTISPTWRYGNFTILYSKCFPFSLLTIQLPYFCPCCTRWRSSAIMKRNTIQLHLHGFWPRWGRDKKTRVSKYKSKKVGLRHFSRRGTTHPSPGHSTLTL